MGSSQSSLEEAPSPGSVAYMQQKAKRKKWPGKGEDGRRRRSKCSLEGQREGGKCGMGGRRRLEGGAKMQPERAEGRGGASTAWKQFPCCIPKGVAAWDWGRGKGGCQHHPPPGLLPDATAPVILPKGQACVSDQVRRSEIVCPLLCG